MQTQTLTPSEILSGYDAVSALYPHIPPLSHWRAWEYAAYQHHLLDGRILDIGCGDGDYFRLIWPQLDHVVGVDVNPGIAELGRQSGVYQSVHVAPAHEIPETDASFDHVFANCSLEHMDRLNDVLTEIFRCLKPGGSLLCSVVTERIVHWSVLPNLVALAGHSQAANALHGAYLDYHQLSNYFSVEGWLQQFMQAGFLAERHTPILPKYNSGIFMLMDSLWHVNKAPGGEIGDTIYSIIAENPKFPTAFRKIVDGLLELETDWQDCSGAVFLLRKPRR